MNKIVLTGLRDLKTDEVINDQTDYGIFLIASLYAIETPAKSLDEEEVKYKLKVERIDSIIDLKKDKQVSFTKSRSQSQKWRFITEGKLGKEEYEPFMKWLLGNFDRISEEYIEFINK
jgi:hypothetical protein